MKQILNLAIVATALFTVSAEAKTFTVKVPKGPHVVTITETRFTSGCSGTETYLTVLKTGENSYLAGTDLKVDDLEQYLREAKRAHQIQLPDATCTAQVPRVTVTQFSAGNFLKASTIKVTTPELIGGGQEEAPDQVKVTEVKGPGVN